MSVYQRMDWPAFWASLKRAKGEDMQARTLGDFQAFPKIARLNREMTITEKLDGTNAAVGVTEDGEVYAQSRKRIITPEDDNFGFAGFVVANRAELAAKLGVGLHFGEWWGSGINRGYGLEKGVKRFSLFNTSRWTDPEIRPSCCDIVPILYEGLFDTTVANAVLRALESSGSVASPGFGQPEGIVVYLHSANICLKATIHKDDEHKNV